MAQRFGVIRRTDVPEGHKISTGDFFQFNFAQNLRMQPNINICAHAAGFDVWQQAIAGNAQLLNGRLSSHCSFLIQIPANHDQI
jgi:hypothetical protein